MLCGELEMKKITEKQVNDVFENRLRNLNCFDSVKRVPKQKHYSWQRRNLMQ